MDKILKKAMVLIQSSSTDECDDDDDKSDKYDSQ